MMRDDRTVYYDFYGKRYPLCLTVLASNEIDTQFGSFDGMSDAISGGVSSIGAWAQLLHILMEGGSARVKAIAFLNGESAADLPAVPELDVVKTILSWEDIQRDGQTIMNAILKGRQPTVEVAPDMGKNVEATQGSE